MALAGVVKGNVPSTRINMIYIYNRGGCLFYKEWNRPTAAKTDDHKLMFGLVYSLKSFTSKMDPLKYASRPVTTVCISSKQFPS